MWGTDPVKLAMKPLARFFGLFGVEVGMDASLVAAAPDPRWRRNLLRDLGKIAYMRTLGGVGRFASLSPTWVANRAWDYLIVLDACRHDTFQEVFGGSARRTDAFRSPPPLSVPYAVSPGSNTVDWIEGNFVNNPHVENLADVVAVAANPYLSRTFFEMKRWKYPFRDSVDVWKDDWDEELATVLPEAVVRATLESLSPRMLIHFLQPHVPFIGEPRLGLERDIPEVFPGAGVQIGGSTVFDRMERGEVPIDEARRAYEGNLRLVLEHVLELLPHLRGRVIITSDHGNLFGEYGLFGHFYRVHVPELVSVPWVELEVGPDGVELAFGGIENGGLPHAAPAV